MQCCVSGVLSSSSSAGSAGDGHADALQGPGPAPGTGLTSVQRCHTVAGREVVGVKHFNRRLGLPDRPCPRQLDRGSCRTIKYYYIYNYLIDQAPICDAYEAGARHRGFSRSRAGADGGVGAWWLARHRHCAKVGQDGSS